MGVGTELPDDVSVHRLARIGANVRLERGASIGAGAIVGDGAHIGRDVRVHDGAAVGFSASLHDGVELGSRSIVGDRAVLGEGVHVGTNCIVGAGAQLRNDARLGADSRVAEYSILESEVSTGRGVELGTGPWTATGPSSAPLVPADHVPVMIDSRTSVGDRVHVGPGAYIGSGCDLRPGALVGTGARIDDGTIMRSDAVVGERAHVGTRSVLDVASVVAAYVATGPQAVLLAGERRDSWPTPAAPSPVAVDTPPRSLAGRISARLQSAAGAFRRLVDRDTRPATLPAVTRVRTAAPAAVASAPSVNLSPCEDHQMLIVAHRKAFTVPRPAAAGVGAPARPDAVAAYRRTQTHHRPSHVRVSGSR